MLISIIIPCYNVSSYLEACVDTVLKAGLSSEIYEVIIIDDGSTDGTALIGEELSSAYSHVFYFKQENRGVSAARNYGLSMAKNKFIWFIDPDDLVKSELVLDLVYMLVDNDLDALGINYYGISEDGTPLPKAKGRLKGVGRNFISGGEFYNLNYKRSYIWQYIIRRDVFSIHNIIFKEGMIMEDSEILPRIMANIYRIGIFEYPVYAYRRRKDSLLRTKSAASELLFMNSAILLAESIKSQVSQYSAYKGLAEGLAKKLIQVNQILYLKFIEGNWSKAQRKSFVHDMKNRGVFPFRKIENLSPLMNFKLNSWRYMVNLLPVSAGHFYTKINRLDK